MNNAGSIQVTAPGEREIVIVREFNAPRPLVFDAWTKPELLKRWFGPPGWTLAVCEVDLRVGGAYRYVMQNVDGSKMGLGGVYREIEQPERIVSTEYFDEAWYPGDAVDTMVLTEADGKTTVTITVLYDTREARDGVLQTGMSEGMNASFDRMAEMLATMA